jgi:Spy/CpxP family protein refolding chaperone
MNKSVKMLLAGAAIIAMSAGAYARGSEDCGHGGMMGWDSAKMEKYHEQHLVKLHDQLKLTAQQEPAWKKFAANNPMADKSARPDPAEIAKLNAPQRLEKGLEHMKATEARLTEHLAALKEFYAVLTPEQQKVFDEHTPRFGGHEGRHEGRREK